MYDNISLTDGAKPFVQELLDNAEKLKVAILKINEATVIDCGINVEGSIEAGLLFANISLGGLAKVTPIYPKEGDETSYMSIQIVTEQPVLATLGCQAASWNINKGEFFGMACGPGRALARKPSKIFKLIEYAEEHKEAILCIESDVLPPDKVIEYLAEKCNVEKTNLILIMIKTECIVEYIQMAARAVELGTFRLVEQLGYPKERILHADGTGIVAPFSEDKEISNDRINNALIYGTKLELIVKSEPDDNLTELISQIPSKFSKQFGKKFIDVFNEAGQNFANMDLSLLAPTEISITDKSTDKSYSEGKLDKVLLKDLFS
ncbi:MAG: methenyltetrahydromethanopterin cyclohydrolase [Candidatus Heimdallarchaeota archaeon]